jgi:hypothetical protein
MSLSSATAAYEDCYAIFDTAVATPGGCRVRVGTRAQAKYLQLRMNQARHLQRQQSKRIYPTSSLAYNTSEYDGYTVRVVEDTDAYFWIYIEPIGNRAILAEIEPIPDDERRDTPATEPPTYTTLTALPSPTPIPDPSDAADLE